MSQSRVREILSLGIDYAGSPHEDLPRSVSGAVDLAAFFEKLGFRGVTVPRHLARASARDVIAFVEGWADSTRESAQPPSIVFYLGGHGRLHNGRHFILSRTSPALPPYSFSKAISAEEVAALILNSRAREALILLDACRVGFAASEVQAALERQAASMAGPPMRLAVLVSSLHHERSSSGLFVDTLMNVVEKGSGAQGEQRHWRDLDPWITPGELCDELCDRLGDEQCARVVGLSSMKVIPNPRYRVGAADRSVELGRLLQHLPSGDREHFLLKASGADAIDLGWFFTGRQEISEQLIRWLGSGVGLVALTGSPGAGKSAVLGRLAVLSDQDAQAACRALGMLDVDPVTLPPVGVFDAVVHLKNKSADMVAAELADQLGIALPRTGDPVSALVLALSEAEREVTVLADGLDEAVLGDEILIARDLLRTVAGLPGCKVLVGTRRDRSGRPASSPDGLGPLLTALSPRRNPALVLDLDADRSAGEAIAAYAERRLSEFWPDTDARRQAAAQIAARSEGVFLYARFAVRALSRVLPAELADGGWQKVITTQIGVSGLYEALAADLNRFEDPDLFHEVLRPLAFARGKGLPRRQIWSALATSLSTKGRAYSAADVAQVIREAGWYLVEATEGDQAVFRLYHQSIADYLRAEAKAGD